MSGLRLPTDRDFYPRFIARPPAPAPAESAQSRREADWEHRHAWELVYDWSVAGYLDKGWECASIEVGRLIERAPSIAEGEEWRRAERAKLETLADRFIETGSFLDAGVLLEDRQAALAIVTDRLRAVMADDFLTRSLLAASPVASSRDHATGKREAGP